MRILSASLAAVLMPPAWGEARAEALGAGGVGQAGPFHRAGTEHALPPTARKSMNI